MSKNSKRWTAYMIREGKEGKNFWNPIGAAFANSDGSINVILDALPVSGKIQLREPKTKEGETDDSPGAPGV